MVLEWFLSPPIWSDLEFLGDFIGGSGSFLLRYDQIIDEVLGGFGWWVLVVCKWWCWCWCLWWLCHVGGGVLAMELVMVRQSVGHWSVSTVHKSLICIHGLRSHFIGHMLYWMCRISISTNHKLKLICHWSNVTRLSALITGRNSCVTNDG